MKIPENENPNKIISNFEKIFQFNNQQKEAWLKLLTLKQMLVTLPIAILQVKVGDNSNILLYEIKQIICYLYQSKEITKKVFDNITKSIHMKV